MPFTKYLKALRENLRTGQAGEHAHRPAFKSLLESLGGDIQALNEPTHVPFGAPDFLVKRGAASLGYVECKDLGTNLDDVERTEQFTRYLHAYANINFILTDYLEFRWYREAELCRAERLGRLTPDRSDVKRDTEGVVQVQELLEGFFSAEPIAVGTAQELARYMAAKAKQLRDNAQRVLSQEGELGSLHALHQAFRETLIHDLDADQFADMYAQTLAYGLFSSCFELRRREPGAEFDRYKAEHYVPRTNPFLRKVFDQIAGPELDRSLEWIANDIAELLNRADMSQIAADFARKPGREDPVVHFYEDFLRAYDPAKRKARGVYYTPEPVVKYIVRSIDHLLKEKFDRPLGLADENVYILDPACGTGTFLYFVINQIKANIDEAGLAGTWSDYVKKHLLPRIFGFELLMAPYTIAHMKLAIQLQDLGYDFSGDERLGIYLTNTLEEAVKVTDTLMGFGLGLAIAEEANAATEIKRKKDIMVVLGNPPYSRSSHNQGTHIEDLMDRYKEAVRDERNIQPLSDDYIKFLRFAHDRIERTGYGIVGMITNHTWLSGLIHRGMREELMNTFPEIYLLDLHGNSRIGETAPDGGPDENVFDIQQGVAISLLVRPDSVLSKAEGPPSQVHHADLWGPREGKYEALAESDAQRTAWEDLQTTEPNYFFIHRDRSFLNEYESGWGVESIFAVNGIGIVTARDKLTIAFSEEEILERVHDFVALPPQEARVRYNLRDDVRDWKVILAQDDIRTSGPDIGKVTPILYRPFDHRFTYYTGRTRGFICMPRRQIMQHMLRHTNMALLTTRMTKGETYRHTLVTMNISEVILLSPKSSNNAYVFTLYLHPEEGTTDEGRRPNLNPDFTKEFSAKLGLDFTTNGQGDLDKTFGPEDIFYYAYAVFHSPTYRERYAEFLKIDFPRLPLTSDRALFAALATKGKRLADLHLLREKGQIGEAPAFNIPGSNEVEKVRYVEVAEDSDDRGKNAAPTNKPPSPPVGAAFLPRLGRVFINKQQYFAGVEPEVWEFQIGGYQVCAKWLKDRTIKKLGRPLSYDDITHYQKIVLALRETRQLMAEIDQTIPAWPIE